MKAMERIILDHLHLLVRSDLDLLQFAYQLHIGVDDAFVYLLQRALSQLESAGSTVTVMFFLLFQCLQYHHLVAWTIDYLTSQPQYVMHRDCVSEVVTCSMWAPQGTVLAPLPLE